MSTIVSPPPAVTASDAAMTEAAHQWALGMTVAEKVTDGTPLVDAVSQVAQRSGETFVAVFQATCRVSAEHTF